MKNEILLKAIKQLFKPHPWHGIPIGSEAPEIVTTYIEIVPTDTIKYELDKTTGYLKVDRPQRFSNIVPAMYGFVPQTYCDKLVAERCMEKTGRTDILGDGDPLDICILTEKDITGGGIILEAIPIGGFRMLDGNEADDKIIAVMRNDLVYGKFTDVTELDLRILDRLRHYFLTYKELPGSDENRCEIADIYGRNEAYEIIQRSRQDYSAKYGKLENVLTDFINKNR